MNEELAIMTASDALKKCSVSSWIYSRIFSEFRAGRIIFVVVFELEEQEEVVTSPATRFVEVDEQTGEIAFPASF